MRQLFLLEEWVRGYLHALRHSLVLTLVLTVSVSGYLLFVHPLLFLMC